MAHRVVILAALGIVLAGCVIVTDVDADWDWDNDQWAKRTEPVVDVDQIQFNARGTLYVTQGDRDKLRLEGHEGALDQLEVTSTGGTLVISQAGDNYRWYEIRENGREPVYTLEIADLRRIEHSGHGKINVGPFTVDQLTVQTSGHARTSLASVNAGSVALHVRDHAYVTVETLDADGVELASRDHGDLYIHDANVLDATVNAMGHGEIFIAGRADSLQLNLHDHTDLDSSGFATAVTTARVRDHAKALVKASEVVQLDERDHASVVITGAARVVSEGDTGR